MSVSLLPATQDLLKSQHLQGIASYVWNLDTGRLRWLLLPEKLQQACNLSSIDCGIRLGEKLYGRQMPHRQDVVATTSRSGQGWQLSVNTSTPDGSQLQLLETAVYAQEDGCSVIYGSLHDVTQLHIEHKAARPTGSYDEMTGLFNKFRLSEMLEHAIAYTQRYKATGAYLTVGIDRLADINNSFGYETGDMVMVNLCQRMRKTLRDADVMGRIDGDRLGIILFNCEQNQLQTTCERFLKAINATPIDTPHGPLQVTVSIGSLMFPDEAVTVFDCMRRSEQALAMAKKDGRNKYAQFVCEREAPADERSEEQKTGAVIRRALADKQFCLAFQSIVDVNDGGVEAYECLLRIDRGRGDIVSAGAFIAMAEKLGLIASIDRYVLGLVCEELLTNTGFSLAFNISGMTVGDSEWIDILEEHCARDSSIASRMIVEITETAAFSEGNGGREFVRRLRQLGCHVALDDFGAGYTSFRQLQSLPVDYIKVDGSFVREFADDETSQIFVRTILDLAKAFKLNVIAEGVETEEHKRVMLEEGISLQQGYLYARPSLDKPWLFGQDRQAVAATGS